MNDLIKDIFLKCEKRGVKWSTYFSVYEKHLNQFIGKKPKILEIGIADGGSTEMWINYFGEGTQIIGIDIDPSCLNLKYSKDVEIVIGDQGSQEFWNNFFEKYENFDIVLDDGGHTMTQQIITLKNVFPKIRNNGIFLVEDLHTSYWPSYEGQFRQKNSFIEYSKNIIDKLNIQHFDQSLLEEEIKNIFKDLYSISYYNSIAVLEKRTPEISVVVHNK